MIHILVVFEPWIVEEPMLVRHFHTHAEAVAYHARIGRREIHPELPQQKGALITKLERGREDAGEYEEDQYDDSYLYLFPVQCHRVTFSHEKHTEEMLFLRATDAENWANSRRSMYPDAHIEISEHTAGLHDNKCMLWNDPTEKKGK